MALIAAQRTEGEALDPRDSLGADQSLGDGLAEESHAESQLGQVFWTQPSGPGGRRIAAAIR
jgi:hypothetical protein